MIAVPGAQCAAGLFAHPRAVAAHVCQTARARPVRKASRCAFFGAALGLHLRPHRRTARKARRGISIMALLMVTATGFRSLA